jgi:hypothetical protein
MTLQAAQEVDEALSIELDALERPRYRRQAEEARAALTCALSREVPGDARGLREPAGVARQDGDRPGSE